MQLENSFHVPLPVDEAWQVLLDIERTAPCMPGVQLDSAGADECTGSIKVKLGPINLTYQGKASIKQKDDGAHRAVIEARGKDQRGNGTAAAVITATLAADGAATRVDVVTDLTITGRPAQFGRGVMTDVGDKMLTQFAQRLAAQLAAPAPAPGPAPGPAAKAAATATGAVEEIAVSVEQMSGDGPAARVVKKAAAATKKAAASATEKVGEPAGAGAAAKKSPAKKTAAAKGPEKAAPAKKTAAAKSSPAKAAPAKKTAAAKSSPAKAPAGKAAPAKETEAAEAALPPVAVGPTDVAPPAARDRRPSGPPKGPSAPPARPATGAPVRSVPSSGPRTTEPAPARTPARPEPIDLLGVSAGGPGRYAPTVGAVAAVVAVVLLVRRRRRRVSLGGPR